MRSPSESKPRWLVNNFIPLVVDDWEGGHPWWEGAYISGFGGTLLGWLVLGGVYVFRYLRRRRVPS